VILGLDGNNWIHSLWHAQHGQGVLNAVCRRIDALSEHLAPSHVVACFDRPSFRHELYPEYKANRKAKDPSLLRDLEEAPAAVMNLATLCIQDGYEADDCLASLAAAGQEIGQKVVLASPDKDLRQCLVAGQVTILRSFSLAGGIVENCDWYTAAHLMSGLKLKPEQWIEFQALLGDTGDHIPGCPGWGEVTTLAAMQYAGSLEAMFKSPLGLPVSSKQRTSLLNFRRSGLDVSLKLVTLCRAVEAAQDALR
jgi:DNA polymerase-1